MTPEAFFDALDGRSLPSGDRLWQVVVYSVSDSGAQRWLQLALEGAPRHMLTLRLQARQSADAALEILGDWLDHPDEPNSHVLNVV